MNDTAPTAHEPHSIRPLSGEELDCVAGGDLIADVKRALGGAKTLANWGAACEAGSSFHCNMLDDVLTNGWTT